jgi:hypothetical protein
MTDGLPSVLLSLSVTVISPPHFLVPLAPPCPRYLFDRIKASSFSYSLPPFSNIVYTCYALYSFLVDLAISVLAFCNLPAFLVISIRPQNSLDSSVGIATGCGLDDQGVGVRVPAGSRIFSSPCRPDRLWGPPNSLANGYWGSFPGGKGAVAWSWPFTSIQCWGQENVDLYIHSPICLRGVMLS